MNKSSKGTPETRQKITGFKNSRISVQQAAELGPELLKEYHRNLRRERQQRYLKKREPNVRSEKMYKALEKPIKRWEMRSLSRGLWCIIYSPKIKKMIQKASPVHIKTPRCGTPINLNKHRPRVPDSSFVGRF